jgi:plasmid stability protein
MRTTINLNDDLLRQAKIEAAKSGRTLASILEDALRESLARQTKQPTRKKVTLPVSTMSGGVQPGVDLYDSASLLDLMDSRDADS